MRPTAWQDKFGLWLSLVERCVRDAEAVGSNPTSPTFFIRLGAEKATRWMNTDGKAGVYYLCRSVFICGFTR